MYKHPIRLLSLCCLLSIASTTHATLKHVASDILELINSLTNELVKNDGWVSPLSSDPMFHHNMMYLRVYHSSLLAREQASPMQTFDIFFKKIQHDNCRGIAFLGASIMQPDVFSSFSISSSSTYTDTDKGTNIVASSSSVKVTPNSLFFLSIDELKKQELDKKIRKLLRYFLEISNSDAMFRNLCSRFNKLNELITIRESALKELDDNET